MDSALAVGSIVLASYVDKRLLLNDSKSTITVSLLLSFWLLSLSVLEISPETLLWQFQYMTLAYRLVLWGMIILLLLFIPILVGSRVVGMLLEAPNRELRVPASLSWLLKIGGLLSCLLHYLVLLPFAWAFGRLKLFRRPEKTLPHFDSSKSISSLGSSVNSWKPRLLGCQSYRLPSFFSCMGGFAGIVVTALSLKVIGPMVVPAYSTEPLPVGISWLVSVGMMISAMLNGFGSVSLPYSCVAGLWLEPIQNDSISKAMVDLERTRDALKSKEQEQRESASPMSRSGESRSFWTNYGQDDDAHRRQLATEVAFLRGLVIELEQDLRDMRASQHLAVLARTPMGRFRSYIGIVFSVVLVIRLCSACSQVLVARNLHQQAHADLVTRLVAWLTGQNIVTVAEADVWSNLISLGLTAILSLSQIRTLIQKVLAVQNRLVKFCSCCYLPPNEQITLPSSVSSNTVGGDKESGLQSILRHVLASIISCYFLACVVITKLMLPPDCRVSFSAVVTGFMIRNETIQMTYLVSAGVSLVTFCLLLSVQRQHTNRHKRSSP